MDNCQKIHGYPSQNKGKTKSVAAMAQDNDNDAGTSVTHISEEQFNNMLQLISSTNKPGDEDSAANSSTRIAGTCLITYSNSKWIIDSGATTQICTNLDLFSSYEKYDKMPNIITITDGKQ